MKREEKHPRWIRAATSPEAFAEEQAALGKLWTFVGFTSDLPKVGDWLRTQVGGRSIFVQRFEDGLRAFENRCAHRFYPLRTADRGNGPILCGFHHWRYNSDGVALGIPCAQEMFGQIPRDMNARIERLDLDTCGDLIFVRFAAPDHTETLQAYLAEGSAILSAACRPRRKPHRFHQRIKAHWKFSHHISLDDYHVVAVHPDTFGKGGYLRQETIKYSRFGRHSAYISTEKDGAFERMVAACANGTYRPEDYAIFNLFPNVLLTQLRIPDVFGTNHWYGLFLRYMPIAFNETDVQAWLFELPFDTPVKPLTRLNGWSIARIVPPIVAHFSKRIMREDNAIVEGQQMLAREVRGEPMLSAQETRIGWFEESYRAALGD